MQCGHPWVSRNTLPSDPHRINCAIGIPKKVQEEREVHWHTALISIVHMHILLHISSIRGNSLSYIHVSRMMYSLARLNNTGAGVSNRRHFILTPSTHSCM